MEQKTFETLQLYSKTRFNPGVPDSVRGRVWKTLSQMRKCKEEFLSSSLPYSELVDGADPSIRDAVLLDIGEHFD